MSTATRMSGGGARPAPRRTLSITVLSGGPSMEREVSLQSGQAVAEALQRRGHRVRLADIDPQNLSALENRADVIFIALHGTFGEDGQLQALLEARNLPYVGSDARSSALAMDKAESKRCFQQAGIPTPAFEVATADTAEVLAAEWPLPAVIKPVDQGSSVDTFIVRDRAALQAGVAGVVARHGRCLLERFVAGPELTVGILGREPLPVCEIRTPREFYDYEAKYLEETTEYLFDIPLSAEARQRVQTLSLQAHEALGCRDFSRVDWMMDAASGRPYVLEVNTIPGFTSHSLLPKSARRVDIEFDELCQRLVDLALKRA